MTERSGSGNLVTWMADNPVAANLLLVIVAVGVVADWFLSLVLRFTVRRWRARREEFIEVDGEQRVLAVGRAAEHEGDQLGLAAC